MPMSDKRQPRYKRILLKLSGEALMGSENFGIDPKVLDRMALEVGQLVGIGVQVGLVIGGGNLFRGAALSEAGMDRVTGDHMGMLATAINALALATSLRKLGVETEVLSAIAMPEICQTYSQRAAKRHLDKRRVVIFAGGTGNPFLTTDTAAALRAAEMGAEVIFKGTQVDGIYSADPKTNPDATRFEELSHEDVLSKGLAVMDTAAVALAQENNLPIIVFSIHDKGGFAEIIKGGGRCTIVRDK